MKKLKITANLLLVSGTWIFVSNILENGSDARILAGIGAALILSYISLNEIWIERKYELKRVYKFALMILPACGIGLFVTNTLNSSGDSEILAGLGAAITILCILIRSGLTLKQDQQILINTNKEIIYYLAFICAFSFWGKHEEQIKTNDRNISSLSHNIYEVQDELNSLRHNVNELEDDVEDLEDYSHYHGY